jgi:phosphoribosyl-AMP cyclohydrolase
MGSTTAAWRGIASDADGSNLIAAVQTGRVYISTSSGVSWSETQPAGNFDKNWQKVASDADGSHLVVVNTNGKVYISTNGGSSWTDVSPASRTWRWSVISSDGQTVAVVNDDCDSDIVYISTNAGASWTQSHVAGGVAKCFYWLAADASVTRLAVGTDGDRLYASENGGTSWAETQPAGATDNSWYALASGSDGSNLIAGVFGGRIYNGTYFDATIPTLSSLSPANNSNNVAVDANLVLTFSEAMATSTGNVVIKKASDGSTAETIDVASSQVTGYGTAIITVNPATDLENSAEYYVQVAAGAFGDVAGNDYVGIDDTVTWTFDTIAATNNPGGGGGGNDGDDGDDDGNGDGDDDGDNDDGEPGEGPPAGTPPANAAATLQGLIERLRTLLAALSARGVALPPQAAQYLLPAVESGYHRDLWEGRAGADVTKLQLYLIAQNEGPAARALAAKGATGYFGSLTRAALAEFQAAVGITPASGYFGPKTRAWIASH